MEVINGYEKINLLAAEKEAYGKEELQQVLFELFLLRGMCERRRVLGS